MNNIRTILVAITGGMRRTPALERGAELAARTGARLHLRLLGHDLPTDDPADSPARLEFRRERDAWLAEQAAAIQGRDLAVDTQFVPTEQAHRALLAKVMELQPDLVLADAHEGPKVDWLAFTTEEQRLLNHCPVPIVMVRPDSPRLPRQVLAAINVVGEDAPSEAVQEPLVQAALSLGRATGAEVHLAHVFPHHYLHGETMQMVIDAEDEHRTRAQERFRKICAGTGLPVAQCHWLEDRPARSLEALVKSLDTDWLVIGDVYRSFLSEMIRELAGSVTWHLVTRTRCDVVLVKPAGYLAQLARRVDLGKLGREYGVALRPAA